MERAPVDPAKLLDTILRKVEADVTGVAPLEEEEASRMADYLRAVAGVVRGAPKAKHEADMDKLLEEAAKDPTIRDLVLRGERGPNTPDSGDDE